MSYHITVSYRPEGKYPFALNTEADQIPLTRAELESLKAEIEAALLDTDLSYTEYNVCGYPHRVIMLKEIKNECPF